MRIHFIATYPSFIEGIANAMTERGHGVTYSQVFSQDNCHDADVIWCDWADENAVLLAQYMTPAKKILRVHSYEVYTDVWTRFSLSAFDHVVFVSEAKYRELCTRLGYEIPNAVVISNYLNLDKYHIAENKQKNNKIAYAGHISRKKGIGELLLIADSLPDYEFHIAGVLQDTDIDEMLAVPRNNVVFHGWQDDMSAFYADKTYVINTSLRESFSVSTIEGMLCGCKPIVRDWNGADDIYPYVFANLDDIREMLKDKCFDPAGYRSYAIAQNRLDTVLAEIDELIHLPVVNETRMPSLTVAIVQTRHKYMATLLSSLRLQKYPIDVKVLQNWDKDKTIGQCFNELADNCDTEWILYVGDDDWLSEGYIKQVMEAYAARERIYANVVGLTTSTIAFDDNGFSIMPHFSTGFWRADFVRQHRFDESLVRQVDTEFHQRVNGMTEGNHIIINFNWIAGYFYRQHNKNVSGNKLTGKANLSQTPVEE